MKKILLFITVVLGSLLATTAYASPLSAEPTRFETSLAAPIGSTDMSMTLVSGLNNDGTPLFGYTCFTIDSNQPNVEDVCGTASGTAITNITRGISGSTGTTTIAALQSSHRRGADVKISDEPFLVILSRILNSIDVFPNILNYDSSIATSSIAANRNSIPSVGLLDDTAFNGAGIINATTLAKGVLQLGTGIQIASTTALGSTGASLAITTANATSTFNIATAPLKVVVTQNSGKIDNNFIATSTLGLPLQTNIQIFTSTTTPGTWTKLANALMVQVILIGGGSGGQGGQNSGSGSTVGAGGGSGGYTSAFVPASLMPSTATVTVGAGTAGTAGANSPAVPGTGGATSIGALFTASGGMLGTGGTGTVTGTVAPSGSGSTNPGTVGVNSVFNLTVTGGTAGAGSGGNAGNGMSATSTFPIVGGTGGSGGGGTTGGTGGNGGLYGAGGGGGATGNTGAAGGKGADGIAEIITYF